MKKKIELIDPTKLTQKQSKKLYNFFESQEKKGIYYWSKNTSYQFNNKFKKSTLFQLPCDVIRRMRKNGVDYRYECISDNIIGEGGFGSVFEISGTFAFDNNKIAHYKPAGHNNKSRVVKVQKHNAKRTISSVDLEYTLSENAAHLAIKRPVIHADQSFLVMRKMKGKLLHEIIVEDLNGTNRLNIDQRIHLSLALLKALKSQVTDKNLIHRDIKGMNTFVDLNTTPIKVSIFDFGLAIKADKPDGRHPCTVSYASPEIFERKEITAKTDVFSMARVIALLWHIDPYIYAEIGTKKRITPDDCYQNARNVNLSSLFTGIYGMNSESQSLIKEALTGMLHADFKMRCTIEQAIKQFEQVNIKINSIAEAPSSSLASLLHVPNNPQAIFNAATPVSKQRIELILQQIDLFKEKHRELRERGEVDASNALLDLATNITDRMNRLKQMSPTEYNRNVLPIIQECQGLISAQSTALQKNRNANYIWANIALAIAGLGLIYFAAALVNKKKTGHYLFFAETKAANMVKRVNNELTEFERDETPPASPYITGSP